MAKAARRCFKEMKGGKYVVGKMCNSLEAMSKGAPKYASGVPAGSKVPKSARKAPLGSAGNPIRKRAPAKPRKGRVTKDGKPDMRFKANYMKGIKRK